MRSIWICGGCLLFGATMATAQRVSSDPLGPVLFLVGRWDGEATFGVRTADVGVGMADVVKGWLLSCATDEYPIAHGEKPPLRRNAGRQ